jgi:hypothetical protein
MSGDYDVIWNLPDPDGTTAVSVFCSISYGMWRREECMCTPMVTGLFRINNLMDQGNDYVHDQQSLRTMP